VRNRKRLLVSVSELPFGAVELFAVENRFAVTSGVAFDRAVDFALVADRLAGFRQCGDVDPGREAVDRYAVRAIVRGGFFFSPCFIAAASPAMHAAFTFRRIAEVSRGSLHHNYRGSALADPSYPVGMPDDAMTGHVVCVLSISAVSTQMSSSTSFQKLYW